MSNETRRREMLQEVETKLIHNIFELQVSRAPNAKAMCFPNPNDPSTNEFWTYQELNEKSNILAHKILQNGNRCRATCSGQPLIATLFLNRQDSILATLAVLKSGGIFIPLNTEYPLDHLQKILKHAGNPLLVTTEKTLRGVGPLPTSTFCVNRKIFCHENNSQNPGVTLLPNDLACIIYKFGATGTPKGVMIEHRSVVNLALWQISFFSLDSSDKSSLFINPAFDASILEIFSCLFIGGSLYVVPHNIGLDMKLLLRWLHSNTITTTNLPATEGNGVINIFREHRFTESHCTSLRYLTIIGEKATKAYPDIFPFQVIIGYGPTEATVQSTIFSFSEYDSSKMATVPIGKPITNVEVYIWNRDTKDPLGEFQIGEIWIGGSGVSRGYLNNEKLTNEKFIQNPFKSTPNERIYKTGDLGRWLPCGNLEIIGRVDNQVKIISGFPVLLDEIECFLEALPQVQKAVVIYDKIYSLTVKQLISFIVFHDSGVGCINSLKRQCMVNLPRHMVPQHWSILKEIPLTPSGEADRKALLTNLQKIEPEVENNPTIKNTLERNVADIWATVLHLPANSIGFSDNFFFLGGHSFLVVQIINRIRCSLNINTVELSSLFKYPNFKDFVSHLQNLPIIEHDRLVPRESEEKVVKQTVSNTFPLSYAQQLVWLHIEKTSSIEMCNYFTWINMSSVNESILEFCINAIFEKHKALRTTILIEKETPYQKFTEHFWRPLQAVEFLMKSKGLKEREILAKEWSETESRKPFDLFHAPLAKFVLIRLDEKVNKLCIIAHHLVIDDVSITKVILPDLCSMYQNKMNGNVIYSSRMVPNIHYGNYALAQQQTYENLLPKAILSISFWKNKLADLTPQTLPTDRVKISASSSSGKAFKFSIPTHLVNKIYLICQQHQTTAYIVLMTVIKILLHRYTGEEDICIWGVTAGRDELATEELVGRFVNLVAFRDKIVGGNTFVNVLKKVTKSSAEVYENQDIPFFKIISESKPNYAHLNQTMSSVFFSMEIDPPENDLGWTIDQHQIDTFFTTFDLAIRVEKKSELMNVFFKYNSDVFEENTIQRLSTHFITLIKSAVSNPEKLSIGTLDILPTSERKILITWSCSEIIMEYVKTKNIFQLFDEQVSKTPNAIAVRDNNGDFVTYQELLNRASSLASTLYSRYYNLSSEKKISIVILLPQSIEFVVSCLAVLKSGAAFIPLSEDFPLERVNFVIEDSKCPVMISNSPTLKKFEINPQSPIILQKTFNTSILNLTDNCNYHEIGPTQYWNVSSSAPAYAIYTSGTTGRPKGVIISHKSVINFSTWHIKQNGLSSDDRSALMATPAFDISIFEIFPYLFCGASLYVAPPDVQKIPKLLLKWLQSNQITMAYLTAVFAQPFVKQDFTEAKTPFCLKKLYTGGNSITFYPDKSLPFDLVNSYGPTETTISATEISLKKYSKNCHIPPIGRPMSNYQIFILDQNKQLVPIGIKGEIYIAGDGLADGYLNQPELTAQKFITKSIIDKPLRLHKTEDLGSWLSDGNIRLIGRIEHQVKIRGFRIDLGEIQSVLDGHRLYNKALFLYERVKIMKKLFAIFSQMKIYITMARS